MSLDTSDELMKIQKRMQKKIQEEKEMDDTVDVIMMITELAPVPGDRSAKEQVMIEGSIRGFSAADLEKVNEQSMRSKNKLKRKSKY